MLLPFPVTPCTVTWLQQYSLKVAMISSTKFASQIYIRRMSWPKRDDVHHEEPERGQKGIRKILIPRERHVLVEVLVEVVVMFLLDLLAAWWQAGVEACSPARRPVPHDGSNVPCKRTPFTIDQENQASGRGRERERERSRERMWKIDRQTDRHVEIETERDRQTDWQSERDIQTYRQTERKQRDR